MTNALPCSGVAVGSANTVLDAALQPDATRADRATPFATLFQPLDDVLGGGFHAQELVLVGGRPGVGKTIASLQWARSLALQDRTAVYVCYEHSPEVLLGRLLALELGSLVREDEVASLDALRTLAQRVALGSGGVEAFRNHPLGDEALGRLRRYGDRLHLVSASGRDTGVKEIEALVQTHNHGPAAVFVDYLQKVATDREFPDESERSAAVVEDLKDLAMKYEALVVAIAASDRIGFEARRMRLHHLRGCAALAHECDVALMFNEKAVAVSKAHLAYDGARAEHFRRSVVVTVEKNRGGPAGMNMEFTKDFASYRFEPDGRFTQERLVDEVLVSE